MWNMPGRAAKTLKGVASGPVSDYQITGSTKLNAIYKGLGCTGGNLVDLLANSVGSMTGGKFHVEENHEDDTDTIIAHVNA